jgi:hypothetical protein
MMLNDWDIWHTYATYFTRPIHDLDRAARLLITSGVAECVVLRDGHFYWRSEDRLQAGFSSVHLHPSRKLATYMIIPQLPAGFAGEVLGQALYFRFAEKRLFGEEGQLPPPYVRAYMGECRLISRSDLFTVYPIVMLYESGTILVEMRMIAPNKAITHTEFIEHHVNLFQWAIEEMWAPPGLVDLAGRTHSEWSDRSPPFWRRPYLVMGNRRWKRSVRQYTKEFGSGDFQFELAPLFSSGTMKGVAAHDAPNSNSLLHQDVIGGKREAQPDTALSENAGEALTCTDLAHAVILAVTFAISAPRTGMPLLFFGQRRLMPLGNFWSARPHIHLLQHEEQQETAQHNEEQHGGHFGCILARAPEMDLNRGRDHLTENARPFADFGAYTAPQATLWVWARQGLEAMEEWSDPNRGHLIYENQVKCELLDYGYMLHQQLAELAISLPTSDHVLRTRRELIRLAMHLRGAGHSGEIRELFERGWQAMGLDHLRSKVEALLAVREAETTVAEARKTNRWSALLTLAFGMITVPTLATEFIKPLWDYGGLWQPGDQNLAHLFRLGIAFVLVGLPLGAAWLLLGKHKAR